MAKSVVDIVISEGGLVFELESLANKQGATIYNICHRSAGWAIQWHEAKRQNESKVWEDGLVVYEYYNKLSECIIEEIKRLNAPPT